MNNSIESSKLFPIAAWAMVVLFALFVYTLTMQLQAELMEISNSVDRLEVKLGTKEMPTQTPPTMEVPPEDGVPTISGKPVGAPTTQIPPATNAPTTQTQPVTSVPVEQVPPVTETPTTQEVPTTQVQ